MEQSVDEQKQAIDSKLPAATEVSSASDGIESVDARGQQKKTLSKRILGIVWDSLDKEPTERAFVAKLDWWILSYVCIAYFVKYLDQTNVSNAYVSGMKEDLNLSGNDLNYLTTYWNIGYILGQLPSQLVMTKVRPSIWLPTLEIIWSVLVMGMAGAKNVETVYVLRFFIGFLEASAYPGIMTILGSWYTPQELGKRSCIFQASSSAAQMFSGYLQAGLYSGMNGKSGLSAWRWLFIFDGVIGIPIATYGAIPDSPTTTKSHWMKPEQKDLAIARMERVGRAPPKKITLKTITDLLKTWPIWLFSAAFITHVLGIRVYSYFNVWLKSTGKYSVEQVNTIPTAGYGLQIIFTLTYAWTSDALGIRWPAIIAACLVALTGGIILSVWPEHNTAAMMAGWLLTFCETGAGGLFMAWTNESYSYCAEYRAISIGFIETMSYTFNAWVPLLVYNTGQSPHFKIGYEMCVMFFALEIVFTLMIVYAERRWKVKR
ncbi:hypothetical protein SLS56_001261 [Neofusicoccum ribis]|uniref:Major facilitator superfamily (MFS) profile domain-containing protein n=1 Tax=Neofusicoccum ribis TaxID=45134 RepID=A0ABR3TA83_9PEZI